jgi:hypothetical protein
MDKKEIIQRIFQEGLLVTPQAMEMINEKNIDNVIESAKKKKIKTIENLDFVKKNSGTVKDVPKPKEKPPKEESIKEEPKEEPIKETTSDIEVILNEHKTKNKLTTKDFVEFYNNKYEGVKELLLGKMKAVSINNTSKSFSEVSVIGMIKEKIPQGFVLEDPTGSVIVVSNEAGLSEDDVIGVTGIVREGKMMASKIVYPDIPLSRKLGSIETEIILTTKLTEKLNSEYIFTSNSDQKNRDNLYVIKTNPCRVFMKRNENSIMILKCDYPNEIDPEEATQWLKKRHLSHSRKLDHNNNELLIKDIPDVLWINSKSKWTKNHKGVIIVSLTENDAARINLQNKEIHLIENIN